MGGEGMTPTYFQCPACGKSFEVASDRSERIFCGSKCAAIVQSAVREQEA